jgi:hypothetical protein
MILHRLEGAWKEEGARAVENWDGNRLGGRKMGKAEGQRIRNPPTAARSRCTFQSRTWLHPVAAQIQDHLWPFPGVLSKEGRGDRFLISSLLTLYRLRSNVIYCWFVPVTLQNRNAFIHQQSG